MPGGFLSHLSYFLCHTGRRFSRGKIKIDLLSGQLLRYLRRAAEIERWTRLLQWRKQQFGVANALMLAVKGDGFSLHQLAPDVGKFSRGLIALGVVEKTPSPASSAGSLPVTRLNSARPFDSRSGSPPDARPPSAIPRLA